MKFLRPVLVLILLIVVLAAAGLWWNQPAKSDMADYAPADALVYVEFNDLTALVQAIQHSHAWQAAAQVTQSKPASQNRVFRTAARAGIGPLPAVLFERAQIALVVVGMNTSEENDTLKVRPEIAIVAETHTSQWRTKSTVVDAVKHLANFAYGASMCAERSADADYIDCSVSGGDRKIVGAVDGTVVVIANSDNAVRSCLEVRRGLRPSMRTDPELLKVRSSLSSDKTLGFGYISPANSAKIFSWVAPLLMGQAPGDQQLEQLLAVSAGKVLRGVAWTASPSPWGIEDRFLFSLDSGIVTRLQPAFEHSELDQTFWKLVPKGFQSLTIYGNKAPASAWTSLDSAVSFKLDALPAVLFGSLLRSSLAVYGISNPKEALATLSPPLFTLRPSLNTEGSILVARVIDGGRLRRSLEQEVFKGDKGQIVEGLSANLDANKEFAAVFENGYVLLGKTENIKSSLDALRANPDAEQQKYLVHASQASAPILTLANDEARLNNFIATLMRLQGRQLSGDELVSVRSKVRDDGFSATTTELTAFGIERTTRSAFGQFSTFTSLLQPDGPSR